MLNFDNMGSLLLTAAILVLLLFLAVAVTPIAFAGIAGYVGYRLYNESPARAERIARDETMALYHAAQARNVSFEEAEIDGKLSAAWPHHTPPALRIQLLEVARQLYEAEGLSPDIPPPARPHRNCQT